MKRVSSLKRACVHLKKRLCRTKSDIPHKESFQSLGLFDSLPHELFSYILSYLTVDDLLTLVDVCARMKFMVELHVRTLSCPALYILKNPHVYIEPSLPKFRNLCEKYRTIGTLFEKLISNSNAAACMPLISPVLSKHLCDNNSHSSSPNGLESPQTCPLGGCRCSAMNFMGYLLSGLTASWSQTDKQNLFEAVTNHCFQSTFWNQLNHLLDEAPGTDVDRELQFRLILRRLFLDPCSPPRPVTPSRTQWSSIGTHLHYSAPLSATGTSFACHLGDTDSGSGQKLVKQHPAPDTEPLPNSAPIVFRPSPNSPNTSNKPAQYEWPAASLLVYLLKRYSCPSRARLMFLLYGPMHRGRLMWRTMCENTAADSEQLTACFGELGSVLQNMLEIGAWTPEETLALLNEITVIPDEWLAENVACLLYTSGPRLASLLITQKASGGQVGELAVTLISLCLVRVKIRATLTDLIGLVGEACRASQHIDRRLFLDQLARAFQDVIVDLYETDELEDRIEDFSTILRAQAEFMRALMARVYEE